MCLRTVRGFNSRSYFFCVMWAVYQPWCLLIRAQTIDNIPRDLPPMMWSSRRNLGKYSDRPLWKIWYLGEKMESVKFLCTIDHWQLISYGHTEIPTFSTYETFRRGLAKTFIFVCFSLVKGRGRGSKRYKMSSENWIMLTFLHGP